MKNRELHSAIQELILEISGCGSAFPFAFPKEKMVKRKRAGGISIFPRSPLNRSAPLGHQCHQLKTGAFVLCEKPAKQMQLVGAGLCSARQDAAVLRKPSANSYAPACLGVGGDAHIAPAGCTAFYGSLRRIRNFLTGRQSRRPLQKVFAVPALCRGGRLCPPAECSDFTIIFGEFVNSQRADVGIGPYNERGKYIRIRRKFPKTYCFPPGGAEPRPYQLCSNSGRSLCKHDAFYP